MFTKSKVTKSMLEAVNSVISEKKMDEADLDETGLRKAAYAAHSSGQKMFTFKGKTYPVRIQGETVTYGEAVQEATSEKVPTPTGMKVYGHRYGDSKKARKDQTKSAVDDIKGPKEKEMKEEMSFKDKLIESVKRSDIPAYLRKQKGDAPLTPAEVKAPSKDSISASQNLAKARNEEVEELDEKAGYSAKAAAAGKDIGKPGKMFAKIAAKAGERYGSKERGEKVAGAILAKLRKEEEDWSDEDIDCLLEIYDLEERKMTDDEMAKREKIVKGMKKGLAGFKARYGDQAKDVMYATATKQAMKEELDEAVSRKDFQMVADLIKTHDSHDKRKELAQHHAEIFHRQNPRFDRKKFMTAANVQEEIDPKVRSKDTLRGRLPTTQSDDVGPGADGKSTKVKYRGGPMKEDNNLPPFDKPYTKIKDVVTDKSGAKHTPMSRARDLARQAFKKVKNDLSEK